MSVKSTPPRVPLSVGAERVLLHKGTWKPKGAAATAYIWLVWVKGMAPLPPFWIPPGQRKALRTMMTLNVSPHRRSPRNFTLKRP